MRGGPGLGLGAADGLVAHLLAVDLPAPAGRVAEVRLEDLAHVHAGRDAERVLDDVDRRAVGQVRHVLDREDLGDDALVAVAPGQLVADRDLALLADVDPHQLVHARGQLVAVLAGEHLDVDDLARLAVRHLERGVADLAGLLAEDGAQQALLGRELGLALGRDLADQHVAGVDLGADAHDAPLVEVLQDVLGQVGDVARDLFGPELGVAGVDLVLVDVDRGEHVVAHEALGQDDGVLEVVALPRHERREQVLPERQLAVVGGRPLGDDVALLERLALEDARLLVDAGVLVGPLELEQLVDPLAELAVLDRDQVARHVGRHAVVDGDDHVGGVAGRPDLDARADVGGLGPHQRHGLLLHVGAHEGPVGVVVLEERDERGAHRDDLLGRDVHELDLGRGHRRDVGGGGEVALALELGPQVVEGGGLRRPADEHALVAEPHLGVERLVGLGDDVVLFLVGGEPHDVVGDRALVDLAVGRLDEAEVVDPRVGGERADEADVRALGRLDGAHAAVVAEVHVADLEAGPLTRQAARAERREAPAVGQARQRVDLVHELGELAGAEELLDGGDDRPDVDERLGRDRLDVLGRHALAHDPLHAGQADAHLVLDQLADRADATVGEVVLVVEAVARLGVDQVEQVREGGQHLAAAEHRLAGLGPVEQAVLLEHREHVGQLLDLGAELAVELVATDAAEVVAAGLEEGVAEVGARRLDRRRLARPGPLVDLDEGLVLRGGEVAVLLPLALEEGELADEGVEEAGGVLLVVAEGAEEHEQAEAALARDPGAGRDVLAGLLLDVELDPLAPVGVDGALDELVLGEVPEAVALAGLEDHTGGTDELRHHDALGAVDHEGALLGHHGEVTHEDRLLLDLAGGGVDEPGAHEDRRRVRHVLFLALLDGELGRRPQVLVVGVELQLELQSLGEVLDGRDVGEGLLQSLLEEPLEGLSLDRHEIGKRERFLDVRERVPIPDASGQRITPQRVRSAWDRVARAHRGAMAKPGTSLLCVGARRPTSKTTRRDHRRTATDHARPSRSPAQPAERQGQPDPADADPGGPLRLGSEGKGTRPRGQPHSRIARGMHSRTVLNRWPTGQSAASGNLIGLLAVM